MEIIVGLLLGVFATLLVLCIKESLERRSLENYVRMCQSFAETPEPPIMPQSALSKPVKANEEEEQVVQPKYPKKTNQSNKGGGQSKKNNHSNNGQHKKPNPKKESANVSLSDDAFDDDELDRLASLVDDED